MLHGLAKGAEDDAFFGQCILKRRLHRHAVHHRINRHSAQLRPLMQWNTQFVEGLHQFRINLIHTFRSLFLLRRRIVNDVLIVDGRNPEMRPCRHLKRLPVAERFQAERQQPIRLVLLCRNQANGCFIQSAMNDICINISHETVFVFATCYFIQYIVRIFHTSCR